MSYMKSLSKCPYSKKPPLPRKIPGCAPVATWQKNYAEVYQEPEKTMMELFTKIVNGYSQKISSQMLSRVVDTPLSWDFIKIRSNVPLEWISRKIRKACCLMISPKYIPRSMQYYATTDDLITFSQHGVVNVTSHLHATAKAATSPFLKKYFVIFQSQKRNIFIQF